MKDDIIKLTKQDCQTHLSKLDHETCDVKDFLKALIKAQATLSKVGLLSYLSRLWMPFKRVDPSIQSFSRYTCRLFTWSGLFMPRNFGITA